MVENNAYILKPHIVAKIWGGERLAKLKSLKGYAQPIGETWEISVHKDGQSWLADRPLGQVIHPEKLPYLVKLIDTSDDLSIQVHPDDRYAREHEHGAGKTECWLILDAAPGAGIYLGLKSEVTKEGLKRALEENQDISKLLNFYPVQAGQFFYVPAGTIHAIGKNVFLAEIQQSSGLTYRVWDWYRMGMDGKPRELHIQKALQVINFSAECNRLENFNFYENFITETPKTFLATHEQFNVQVINLQQGDEITLRSRPERYQSLLCLQGRASFDNIVEHIEEKTMINAFQAAIILNDEIKVQAHEETLFVYIQ